LGRATLEKEYRSETGRYFLPAILAAFKTIFATFFDSAEA
jgi:hypothetical protein